MLIVIAMHLTRKYNKDLSPAGRKMNEELRDTAVIAPSNDRT